MNANNDAPLVLTDPEIVLSPDATADLTESAQLSPRGDSPRMTRQELDAAVEVIRQGEKARLASWAAVTDIIDRDGHRNTDFGDADSFFVATFGWARGQASRNRLAYLYVKDCPPLQHLGEHHVRVLRLGVNQDEATQILGASPELPNVKELKTIVADFNKVKAMPLPEPISDEFAAICTIVEADALELLDRQPDGSLDLIFSDLDWNKTGYYGAIASRSLRKLRPDGVMALMVGDDEHDIARDEIRQHRPIRTTISYRTPGPSCPIFGKNVSSGWKPIIVCGGDRNLYNYIESPGVDHSVHPWGLHPEGVVQIIDRLCPTKGRVLDPMVGGGATAIACMIAPTGLRYFVGGDNGHVADLVEGADPKLTWAQVATARAAKAWAEIQAQRKEAA